MNRMPTLGRFLGAVTGCLLGTTALADPIDWKVVRGWDISFYPASEGCQAFALFEEDTAFFIGFDNTENELSLDVTLLDQKWRSIEAGKEYKVEVKFGDESPWTMDMDGLKTDEFPGLGIMIDAGSDQAKLFIDEFQRENSMKWSFKSNVLGHYTLRGSRAAFDEVIACQRSYMRAQSSSDPFAQSSSDPFAD
ncbi:hypothetical protein J7426_03700 [Tropicibacter sp. R16_0]|uniref:hypothetical protein n=1 Tax=Tropicibacter sp. R16_0 TaxID=2821102 RepID=UPI001ADADACA|nr:hypothetical protein [Tropicibacter sp. R16_0]MBO9449347.1 hypothetical protein [Tropicibacter sp. R16_0]